MRRPRPYPTTPVTGDVESDLSTFLPRREPSRRTRLLGILNLTPDSFHDGGVDASLEDSVARATRMIAEGADGLDLGAESTRPGATPLSPEDELARLLPVLERVAGRGVPVSVDTTKAAVARRALAEGATIVNDVSGLQRDPGMAEILGETGAPVILMHMRGTPRDMQRLVEYDDVVAETIRFLESAMERAVRAGVDESRIVIDPGLGFAKTAEHNFEILRRLPEYSALGRPVLIGASRKSFLATASGESRERPDTGRRLEGTLAVSVLAVLGGASILRVHDVEPNRRAVATTENVLAAPAGVLAEGLEESC
jgi:dihydropteroate synthase